VYRKAGLEISGAVDLPGHQHKIAQ
jgi:hypothetical protein